jgi:alanyl-tRNA synthetase
MLTKKTLMERFRKKPNLYWKVELFDEKGFKRRRCSSCGKHFWSLDPDRKLCGDPPCENYGFIGSPITGVKWDYVQTWKAFERFFMKNGHASVPRYPVIDRWRPDLFFTIASIQDFQRLDKGNMVFEYPANPLVVPQLCLRFPDIQNVGVTGRHHTSFVMSGQHAFGHPREGYFKDRCLELNFRFLTEAMGIPQEELTYVESLWAMPDLSAFGPSMETISRGLELVNSVFMQFTRAGSSFRELPLKVIDVGWGHERLVWFTQGTRTGYDAVFGPVIEWLMKEAGLKDSDLLERYAVLTGGLDTEETRNLKKARELIAKRLGVSVRELSEVIEPSQALYAIADHTRTLLFAITDGGIPSNMGGGYNLRVLLRRMLSFMNELGLDIDLNRVAQLHTKHLHPMFPELSSGLDNFAKILDIERGRYEKTLEKAGLLIQRELGSGRAIDSETMVRLYTSNGITPELVEKVAREQGLRFSLPEDFYSKLTQEHMTGEKEQAGEALRVDVSGIPKTRTLFYEKPYDRRFRARVLARLGDWIALDRTLFYAEGGGQLSDRGTLWAGTKGLRVLDVQRLEDVILHKVDRPGSLKKGQPVRGEIDWERRHTLMKMHTCTHLVAGAARRVLGSHIWQAGAKKGLETSRIDLTHYRPFTPEELGEIESLANDIIRKDMPVKAEFMPRGEAEKKYGFTLYQGGASPGKLVRVVNTANGFDVEACGGTHLSSTGEVELVKITRTERIQDGVNRLEYTCGKPAFAYLREQEGIAREIMRTLSGTPLATRALQGIKTEGDLSGEIQAASAALSVEPKALARTVERFVKEISGDHEKVNQLRATLDLEPKELEEETYFLNHSGRPSGLGELAGMIFGIWKDQKKFLEALTVRMAKDRAARLIPKARGERILEVVPGERKLLIEIANQALKINPNLTVILANQAGDIISMSRTRDASRALKELLEKAGGSGGGSRELAQGRAELSKLMKLMPRG